MIKTDFPENKRSIFTSGRRQSKTSIPRNDDKNIRNIVFDCYLSPDWRKIQSKTLFLSIFDPRSSIVKSVFDCHLPV